MIKHSAPVSNNLPLINHPVICSSKWSNKLLWWCMLPRHSSLVSPFKKRLVKKAKSNNYGKYPVKTTHAACCHCCVCWQGQAVKRLLTSGTITCYYQLYAYLWPLCEWILMSSRDIFASIGKSFLRWKYTHCAIPAGSPWKAPNACLRSGAFDHVIAVTAKHRGHMIEIPASSFQRLVSLKELGG